MKKHQLFPTTIFTSRVNLNIPPMIEYLYKEKQVDKGVKLSNKGGWQSKSNLHLCEIFNPLINFIVNNLPFKGNSKILNMWGNISNKSHFNFIHHHGRYPDIWSGVYYLQIPPNSGDLVFHSYWDTDICESLTPIPGGLVIFPSSLSHQVEPNMSNQDRISISFNFKINQING
jgi:hypothetical protein